MPAAWGPWEPYTQTVTTGRADVLQTDLNGVRVVRAYLVSFGPFDSGIFADQPARICCLQHVQVASPMSGTWVTGFGSCPPMVPNTYSTITSALNKSGITIAYSGGGGLNSTIEILGYVYEFAAIANTNLSHGVPSWQDPHNAAPPPQFDYDGGQYVEWDYDLFTSLDGTLTPNGVLENDVDLPFQITAMEVTYGDTNWNVGDTGTPRFVTNVDAGGGAIFDPTPIVLDHLLTGHHLQFAPSCLHDGFFAGTNDPYNARGDYLPVEMWAVPSFYLTIRRTGQRRRRLSLAGLPLHQRQRGDGLGGGPSRTGRGQNGRQRGMFARGIF